MSEDAKRVREMAFRRRLRREATPAEAQLWPLLRGRALDGCKFRRQVLLCGWVVDFACLSHKLVVELDGAVHDDPEQAASDMQRDAWLHENGWTVLRFRNGDLQRNPADVLGTVSRALSALTPAAARRPLSR